MAAAFGKVDHEVVVGSNQGRVSIRDTETWEQPTSQQYTRAPVRALTVSPDKRTLATGGDDGVITLWHTATWQKIADLRGHTGSVTALEFTPDSSRLASGGVDKKIIV